ncbi:unnamed protein product, partial [Protopolystoma xenopodis]
MAFFGAELIREKASSVGLFDREWLICLFAVLSSKKTNASFTQILLYTPNQRPSEQSGRTLPRPRQLMLNTCRSGGSASAMSVGVVASSASSKAPHLLPPKPEPSNSRFGGNELTNCLADIQRISLLLRRQHRPTTVDALDKAKSRCACNKAPIDNNTTTINTHKHKHNHNHNSSSNSNSS